jgi:hypothetical protein
MSNVNTSAKVTNLRSTEFNLITNTSTHTIKATALVFPENTVIANLKGTGMRLNGARVTELTGLTRTAGFPMFGVFTEITLASGSVEVHT